MRATALDDATVQQLFSEIAFEASVLAVTVKTREPSTSASPLTLRAARDALFSGEATDVQIRYVHGGIEWWDTLQRTVAGIQLVRVRK